MEYTLILALVALATIAAVTAYGTNLGDLWAETVMKVVDALIA